MSVVVFALLCLLGIKMPGVFCVMCNLRLLICVLLGGFS